MVSKSTLKEGKMEFRILSERMNIKQMARELTK